MKYIAIILLFFTLKSNCQQLESGDIDSIQLIFSIANDPDINSWEVLDTTTICIVGGVDLGNYMNTTNKFYQLWTALQVYSSGQYVKAWGGRLGNDIYVGDPNNPESSKFPSIFTAYYARFVGTGTPVVEEGYFIKID